jgi:hypothetical protein
MMSVEALKESKSSIDLKHNIGIFDYFGAGIMFFFSIQELFI